LPRRKKARDTASLAWGLGIQLEKP